MPVGRALSDQIAKSSYFSLGSLGRLEKGDQTLYSILRRKYPDTGDLNKRLLASRKIADGIYMASSIDNYIDIHSDDPFVAEVGKLQIAYNLFGAERASLLHINTKDTEPKLDLRSLAETWLDPFARILFEQVRRTSIDRLGHNISIITFNYDRCIELYMTESIRQTFQIDYREAHDIVSNMNIIHPYGSLGQLPYSPHNPHHGEFPFGMDVNRGDQVLSSAQGIKTYTEQIEDSDLLEHVHRAVDGADHLVFLGFAFHPQNMQILTLPGESSPKTAYATGYGVSPDETEEVTTRILKLYESDSEDLESRMQIKIAEGATCAELFRRHWRNLSAS